MCFTGKTKMPRYVNPPAKAGDRHSEDLDGFIILIKLLNYQIGKIFQAILTLDKVNKWYTLILRQIRKYSLL